MSYTNQTTTNLADLISKLNTFLSGTPGWTTHHNAAGGEFAARKTAAGVDIGFASQWDTGSPNSLGIYQFYNAAYNSGLSPWAQTNDSGNGAASTSEASLIASRSVVITNTPVQFWCFEDDNYFHVVVQVDADEYAHFGAGVLDKFNDYTGGEYVYGHRNSSGTSAPALSINSTVLLDGILASSSPGNETYAATIHLEGLANQVASGKYAVCMGNHGSANLGNDRQAAPKARLHVNGGFRAGFFPFLFGQFPGSVQRGLLPMYPITPVYWDRTTDHFHGPLGMLKDVRGLNIRDFAAGDEVTIGSDTWTVFPTAKKALTDAGTGAGFTEYQGIAYKKVTT